MENPAPGSSRGDNRALQGVGCSLRKEIHAGTTPVPSGSSRDPAGSRGEEEEAEPRLHRRVDWITGKMPKSVERPRIDVIWIPRIDVVWIPRIDGFPVVWIARID